MKTSSIFKALIVEDEIQNQLLLEEYLLKYSPFIEVIVKTTSIKQTLEAIDQHKPDVLFLDIELADGNAFELLDKIEQLSFEIIFTTSHEKYALKALKINALEYLLKPINITELVEATTKLLTKKLKTSEAISNYRQNKDKISKIAIYSQTDIVFKNLDEIVYIESDESYSTFYFTDRSKIISSKNIKFYEELLLEAGFFRIHKSYLINTMHISRVHKEDYGVVELCNNIKVPISKRKRSEFYEYIKLNFKG